MEELFGVGASRTQQLMAGLSATYGGNAAANARPALIGRMEETAASEVY